ncbi:hypothetical protein LXA43DRAFT_1063903 [Ganoderma leucocontextum]|nr:hypothetical protein LXA43DRAFT_1063903 [Ganoderma leucocontextum]
MSASPSAPASMPLKENLGEKPTKNAKNGPLSNWVWGAHFTTGKAGVSAVRKCLSWVLVSQRKVLDSPRRGLSQLVNVDLQDNALVGEEYSPYILLFSTNTSLPDLTYWYWEIMEVGLCDAQLSQSKAAAHRAAAFVPDLVDWTSVYEWETIHSLSEDGYAGHRFLLELAKQVLRMFELKDFINYGRSIIALSKVKLHEHPTSESRHLVIK